MCETDRWGHRRGSVSTVQHQSCRWNGESVDDDDTADAEADVDLKVVVMADARADGWR